MKRTTKLITALAALATGLALAACETTKGLGKDIETGAQKTQDLLDGK